MKRDRFVWQDDEIIIEDEVEDEVTKAESEPEKIVHGDDGLAHLYPLYRKGDLCFFDEGDVVNLRKMHEGILKTIKKDSITESFWKELEKDGWEKVVIK